ncbi:hypothetical protein HYC85_009217 [Camellia sinensis]|uniref:Inosine/uridine-preferring nucleoside hydrolase domain-containing protein n=1 Tax=Camellia sinensis TaxID=4442 RepID=A0A7J7HEE1_CAMSI|nr:hypothetical protein HYC85_009217 [Camellia sinensis]
MATVIVIAQGIMDRKVPMMMKKLLLKDKQPLYWWFEWDDVTMLNGIKSQAICSFCTKLTDTVSSEIGKAYGKTTILIYDSKFYKLGGRPRVADFVHGSDGLGNISLPPPKSKKIEKKASEFLVDMAMKRDSSFASKVKRVVILGGSFFALGNVNPAAEANAHAFFIFLSQS